MDAQDTIARIKQNFSENINSHVFLFETNNSNKALEDIKTIIKDILNADELTSEQIENESYIELILIRPDGKDIKKDQVLSLQERLRTKPILSNYLFYIIIDAHLLNEAASNKLLKTIEEPNENTIGFLISKSLDLMLPTIKSRCEINSLEYNIEENSSNNLAEIDQVACKIIEYIESGSLLDYHLYKSDKNIKEQIKENGKDIANLIKDYYNTASNIKKFDNLNYEIVSLIKDKSCNYKELISKTRYLNETLNKLVINMNTDVLLEKIIIELKEVKTSASSGNKI